MVFDKQAALDRVDNDTELLIELLELATSDAHKKFPILKSAIENRLYEEVHRTAHSMKSAFGNVGGMQCFEICLEIEKKGKNSQDSGLVELYDRLYAACEELQREVAKFKGSV